MTASPAAGGRRSRTLPSRWLLRWVLLLLLAPLLGGCSVKFLYNNADRFVMWRVDDYVDLERAQRDWLRARLRMFFHWHRTEQLPQWAETLRDFDLAVQDGIDGATLDRFYGRAMNWSDEIVLKVVPTAAELMATFTAEQVAQLPERLDQANARLNEDYAGLTEAEQRALWRRETREFLDDWIGDLAPGQELLLEAASEEVVPDNSAWIGYRERWQGELLRLLEERRDLETFAPAFMELSRNRERWFTPEYARVRQRNERVYRQFAIDLLGSLTDRQMQRLSERLDSIAEDFDQLAD